MRHHNSLDDISTLRSIWDDQLEFNRNFRTMPAPTFEQRTAETKELVLHLVSECDELLRASGAWKPHRKEIVRENPRSVRIELIDIFKYVMSVAQLHGFTVDDFIDTYWEKSMVVRQRHSQEFVQTLDGPTVIVDIDNVLADYIGGFVAWAESNGFITAEIANRFYDKPEYITAKSLGVPQHLYEEMKHLFRISGMHSQLLLMPQAPLFMQWVVDNRWAIVLLTSRPIDRYPNLYGETLRWLDVSHIPYNFVWWARDKGEILLEKGVVQHVVFAVDDEWDYVRQMTRNDIKTYWLTKERQGEVIPKLLTAVPDLTTIMTTE